MVSPSENAWEAGADVVQEVPCLQPAGWPIVQLFFAQIRARRAHFYPVLFYEQKAM